MRAIFQEEQLMYALDVLGLDARYPRRLKPMLGKAAPLLLHLEWIHPIENVFQAVKLLLYNFCRTEKRVFKK